MCVHELLAVRLRRREELSLKLRLNYATRFTLTESATLPHHYVCVSLSLSLSLPRNSR